MPDIKVDDGCTIHAEIEGPERAPVLMLSNSLGTNLHMWDEQAALFTRHFRLLRYDRRGHGKSSVPKGPYTMERLGRDVLGVLDALGIEKINWCGLSMGGMVGMWLGANAANRIDKLILSNTSAYFPDKTAWEGRIKLVREKGLAGIVDANMERWFTAEFRERSGAAMAKMREMFLATNVEGYVGCGEAIRDMDHRPLLPKIARPTLVIAGRRDPATTLEAGEYITANVPGAKIAVLEAAHISNLEQPTAYAETVLGFLLK
jgi:3-oxoadipate enol-lactonase